MWVHSFFSSSCSKVCSLPFWRWFVFIQFERSLWLTAIIWHGFLAVLKICLNSGSTRAGNAKFAGAFSTFQDFNGHCPMSLHFFFFLLWPVQNPENAICFLKREEGCIYGGRKACSDIKYSFSLRIGCSPRKWGMSMYVNFLTCKTSLCGFTCTLLLFLSGLRLSFASSIGYNLCTTCPETN